MTNISIKPSMTPIRKVTFGAVGGALVTLLVSILNNYVPFFEAKPITGDISSAATTLVTFAISYLVNPDPRETTIQDDKGVRSART